MALVMAATGESAAPRRRPAMARRARAEHGLRRALCLLVLTFVGCVSAPPTDRPASLVDQAEARRNVGIDHVLNGRIAFGIRDLRYAIGIVPDDAYSHLWLGEAYRQRRLFDDAIAETKKAIELDPDLHEARLNLSVLYLQMERYEDAIEQCDVLIADATFASPWRAATNRGWAALKLHRYDEARESFNQALDFNIKHWPAVLNLGILAQAEGHWVESLRYYLEVLKRAPGPNAQAEANYRIAESYVRLGQRERALDHLTKAIQLTPDGMWGRQSREYLHRLM